jgi:hypothetical protein
MTTADGDEFFSRFKWEILGDAAFEDVQGLWEPLWLLRGYLKQPGMEEIESQELAERALRELQKDGLIYFFRVPARMNPSDASDVDSLRLTADQVDATLVGDWWRGLGNLPSDHPNVWWWVTEKGRELADDPPEHVKAYWRPGD